jgi:two-component SAPR family response regulator
MKIKCIIVDDEHLAIKLLEDHISKMPQLELVTKCSEAPEALAVLQNEDIDLMFIDIQMPDLTGINFLKSLNKKPVVIFTTAYPEYALDG